jgi:hypothetical protein
MMSNIHSFQGARLSECWYETEYPAVVHRKRQRTVALYVLTRPREEFTINPLFPRWSAILYEDRDREQWVVLREPLAFSEHAANHLRTSKDTPGTWSYGRLLQKGYEHVKMMICHDAQKNQHEKNVVKDIGIHSTEKPCDPTELVDEPREIYLNRKLRKVVAGMISSILQMDSEGGGLPRKGFAWAHMRWRSSSGRSSSSVRFSAKAVTTVSSLGCRVFIVSQRTARAPSPTVVA